MKCVKRIQICLSLYRYGFIIYIMLRYRQGNNLRIPGMKIALAQRLPPPCKGNKQHIQMKRNQESSTAFQR